MSIKQACIFLKGGARRVGQTDFILLFSILYLSSLILIILVGLNKVSAYLFCSYHFYIGLDCVILFIDHFSGKKNTVLILRGSFRLIDNKLLT